MTESERNAKKAELLKLMAHIGFQVGTSTLLLSERTGETVAIYESTDDQRFMCLVQPVIEALQQGNPDLQIRQLGEHMVEFLYKGDPAYCVLFQEDVNCELPGSWEREGLDENCEAVLVTNGLEYAWYDTHDQRGCTPGRMNSLVRVGTGNPDQLASWLMQFADPKLLVGRNSLRSETIRVKQSNKLEEFTTSMMDRLLSGRIRGEALKEILAMSGVNLNDVVECAWAREVVEKALSTYRRTYDVIVRNGGTPINVALDTTRMDKTDEEEPNYILVDALTNKVLEPEGLSDLQMSDIKPVYFDFQHCGGRRFGGAVHSKNGQEILDRLLDACVMRAVDTGKTEKQLVMEVNHVAPELNLDTGDKAEVIRFGVKCSLSARMYAKNNLTDTLDIARRLLSYLEAMPGEAVVQYQYTV